MSSSVLNDKKYDFEPLKLFVPSPNYKVDEEALRKSIEKNKAIIEKLNIPKSSLCSNRHK